MRLQYEWAKSDRISYRVKCVYFTLAMMTIESPLMTVSRTSVCVCVLVTIFKCEDVIVFERTMLCAPCGKSVRHARCKYVFNQTNIDRYPVRCLYCITRIGDKYTYTWAMNTKTIAQRCVCGLLHRFIWRQRFLHLFIRSAGYSQMRNRIGAQYREPWA